jgi:PAS domain S-box-containing protein
MDDRTALRLAQVGWFDCDIPGNHVTFSPEAHAILGVPAGLPDLRLLDERILVRVHPDDVERVRSAWNAVVDGETRAELDFLILSHAGDVRFVDARIEVVVDATGRRTRVFGTIQDVTERRNLEERLATREELFRAVLDHATDALFLHGSEGVIVDVNRQACETLGYAREELLGMSPLAFDADLDREQAARIRERIAAGELVAFESHHRRKDGTTFPVEVHLRRFVVGGRSFSIALARDITIRRRLQEQLLQAQKMEAVGQLAGGIAHDFNNLLTTIIGETELALEDGELPGSAHDALDRVRTAGADAARLTKRLLLFSRREVMRPQPIELSAAVAQFVRTFEPMIGVDVRVVVTLHVEPLVATVDPAMLEQVLTNLASNARDAMPNGGTLTVETAVHAEGETRYGSIRVRDTGVGIAPDVLPRIFEPFFSTKTHGRGIGLGLATSFGIVEQHRGRIVVTSELGSGSTFEVRIPLHAARSSASLPAAERTAGTRTVLIVEDDPQVRALSRRLLAAAGFRVLEAEDASTALAVWTEHHRQIDVVLTDLVMPGMGGQELAKALRVERPKIPVVFMSGYSADIAGTELRLSPEERFVAKPFTRGELLDALRQALEA